MTISFPSIETKSRIAEQMCKVGDRTLDDGWHTLMRGLITAYP
jgi:hypothetical protein